MRKTLLAISSILLLSACAQDYVPETANHPAMYPSNLPEITALHITENAKGAPKNCKNFRVTEAQALAYFHTAKTVATSGSKAPLCSAQGGMTLAFEGPAKWTINETRFATLTKQNGAELRLFCPGCILGNAP